MPPSQIDWYSTEAVNYKFKQDAGDFNSLGSIKINFSTRKTGQPTCWALAAYETSASACGVSRARTWSRRAIDTHTSRQPGQ
jgi:hypothetical protein